MTQNYKKFEVNNKFSYIYNKYW